MAFILNRERAGDVVKAFADYREYLQTVRDRFPASAYALATSDWYFNPQDHRCPHDAWLEWVRVDEPSSGERHEIRSNSLRVRLLGAYHDGHIEFYYPKVFSYSLRTWNCEGGHCDWRYDEFRLSPQGDLIHEIEWSGLWGTGNWIIEASDVEFAWMPRTST